MRSWKAWLGIELSEVSHKEKLISAAGGMVSLLLLLLVGEAWLGHQAATAIVASMGASAVLLFAAPHGQLSQPWPVVAGHTLSALAGVACSRWIPQQEVAAAVAVGLAIGLMHQFKCLHPPGGATAFTAVWGGETIRALGFHFVFFPVLANALVMVALAVAFNAFFGWRRYPAIFNRAARAAPATPAAPRPSHEEVVEALRALDSFVDITEEDLVRLYQILALHDPDGTARKEALEKSGQHFSVAIAGEETHAEKHRKAPKN